MKTIKFLMAILFSIAVTGCWLDSGSSTPATYGISGTVTSSDVALSGVTVTLTGGATTTTNASGNYSFTGLANGNYTVTPSKTGYAFSPVSLAVSVSGANVTGTNFTATVAATTYSISGTVSGAAGVKITLSGDNTGSVVTGAGGTYTLSGLVPGNYAVTPSLTGFTFSPTSTAVTITDATSAGNNFVATAIPVSFSISGTVTSSGAALPGVTITVTGTATATATTDADGNYSVPGLHDGNYTVMPSKAGYIFTPSSSAVNVSGANITVPNFVAAANSAQTYSISGAVSGDLLSGVSITLSGAGSATTTTNGSGNYTFAGLVNGSYTVTPSMTGYTFSPVNAAANVSGTDITVTNFVATAVPTTYNQADLTGTWRINMLRTGSTDGWLRAIGTADASGFLTLSSFLDSTGSTSVPAANTMQWTINASGVISGSGVNEADQVHMTMTSNKNFIAGTGSDGTSQLRIIQKVVPGTVYSNADIRNKSFVFHQLSVGSQYKWVYGVGTSDATGLLTTTSETDPSGPKTPGALGTFSVDGNGVVTVAGDSTFQGFLSDDKKTIVATYTSNDGSGNLRYRLLIIQITGQTYTAGPMPAGTSAAHMLAGGAAPAPFWLHDTITVASGGVISFSDWVASNLAVTAPTTTYTGFISASGTVTITEIPSFHGQISHDGKFTVSTQTIDSGAYSLQVNTK